MNKSNYFFCYDKMLHKYIHNKYNLRYICTARHENTYEKFWLYERNETLDKAIGEYKEIFNK